MPELLAQYTFEGDYMLGRRKGSQKGTVYHLSSDLLVGFAEDDNTSSNNYGPQKLLLGVHDSKKDEIGILKIAPGFHLKPVSWWLKADSSLPENSLRDSYSGYYLFHEGLSLAYQLGEFIEEKMPSLEELFAIDLEPLISIYFTHHNFREIKKQAHESSPQSGSMRFVKQ